MKGYKTNLILSVILAVLGSFSLWFVYTKKPADEVKEASSKKLFTYDSKDVLEKIQIQYTDSTNKQFVSEMHCTQSCDAQSANSIWEIIKPIPFKGDEGNIAGFINSLSSTKIEESISIDAKDTQEIENFLKRFGLEKEKRSSKFSTIKFKNHTYTIYIGDDGALSSTVYGILETDAKLGSSVLLLTENIKSNLSRNFSYWRSKKIFNFAASQIKEISLQNSKGKFDLKKNEKADWITSETNRPIDQQVVDTFATGLIYMNAQEYFSDDKNKDMKLNSFPTQPKVTLTLTVSAEKDDKNTSQPTKVNLDLYEVTLKNSSSNKVPKMFGVLKDKNFIFEIDKTSTEKFNKSKSDFWLKNIVSSADIQKVRKIKTILFDNDEKKRISLQFESTDGTHWTTTNADLAAVLDETVVSNTLDKLSSLKIAEFSELSTPPKVSATELSSWDLYSQDGALIRSFKIFGDLQKTGDYYIKLANEPFAKLLAKLEKPTAIKLPINRKGFQKLSVDSSKK